MRLVRTRSIPNVETERLVADLNAIHVMIHTLDGLHEFSDTRRSLIQHGVKARRINAEIVRRGLDPAPCPHCSGPPPDHFIQ